MRSISNCRQCKIAPSTHALTADRYNARDSGRWVSLKPFLIMISLRRANVGNDMKHMFFSIRFSRFNLTENYSVSLYFNNKISMRSVLTRIYFIRKGLKKLRIAVERSKMTFMSKHIITNQNSYHDDKSTWQCLTCLFCPQLIRIVGTHRCIDSSSIIAPTKFRYTAGEITKNSLSLSLSLYIYIYIYVYV